MRSRPRGASRPPGGVYATTGGWPSIRRHCRGRTCASGDQALPALVQARAPGAPVPALAVRRFDAPPRAPSQDLWPTAGAPAATVLLLADPLTSPPVLAPVPRPAARFLGVPDAPAPVPPLLADAPAPGAAVVPPSPRLAAELQGAALVLSRGLLLIAGAPAPTALHLAELSIAPRARVPAVRPAAAPPNASDAPAPAPPSLAGAPAPSVRPHVRFLHALVVFARGFPSIVDPSPLDTPLTAGAPETPAPVLPTAFAVLRAAAQGAPDDRAATRNGSRLALPTSASSARRRS